MDIFWDILFQLMKQKELLTKFDHAAFRIDHLLNLARQNKQLNPDS